MLSDKCLLFFIIINFIRFRQKSLFYQRLIFFFIININARLKLFDDFNLFIIDKMIYALLFFNIFKLFDDFNLFVINEIIYTILI